MSAFAAAGTGLALTADLGDVLPFSSRLYSAPPESGGALVNATSATLTITLPDGTVQAPVTVPPPSSVGDYRHDLATAMAGRYVGRWLFTLAGQTTAYVESFDVRPADPLYIVSLADTKRHLNIPAAKTGDDEELRSYIEAATRVVEEYRGETIVRRSITEQLDVEARSQRIALRTSPILSLTSVERVDGTQTWNVSALSVDADLGSVGVISGPLFYGRLKVVFVAGYQVIPATYTLAAKIIIEHLWQLQRKPSINAGGGLFGSLGADRGSETDSTPSGFGFAIPNRAVELLGSRSPVVA